MVLLASVGSNHLGINISKIPACLVKLNQLVMEVSGALLSPLLYPLWPCAPASHTFGSYG